MYYYKYIFSLYPTYVSAIIWPSSGVTCYIYTSLYTVQFGTVIPLLFCQCYYFTLEVTSTALFVGCRCYVLRSSRLLKLVIKLFKLLKLLKPLVMFILQSVFCCMTLYDAADITNGFNSFNS
jgi:hypothetical protein